jgi:hypothetical protein
MDRKLSVAASRNVGIRLFRWSALALVGAMGGMMLGEMAVGKRLVGQAGEHASYSHLSANPGALMPQGDGAAPCVDCADSYGVALRLRAHRDDRMSDEFRELGAVDIEPPLRADARDDYRYGGRFPDPEPIDGATSKAPPAAIPAGGSLQIDMITPAPAEY